MDLPPDPAPRPRRRAGKLTGSVLLAFAAVLLLWFVVFPAVEPHLRVGSTGQVSDQDQQGNDGVVPGPTGSPTGGPSVSPTR